MRTLLLMVGVGLALAAPAWGQTAAAKKEAGTHYQRGVGLYKEANYAAALSEFRAAQQLVPSVEVLFNIGLCERRLFKYGPAIKTLNEYLAQAGDKAPKERRQAVAQELEQIRQLTAPIAIIVKVPQARVLVDGEVLGTSPLTEMVPLGSGQHVVRAEAEGHTPDERRIEVVSGQPQAVSLEPRSLTAPVAVTFETAPPGAQLAIDGAAPLRSPAVQELVPGVHEVLARLDGHAPSRTEVVVQPATPRTVRLELVALPPPVARRAFPRLGVGLMGAGAALASVGGVFAWQASVTGARVATMARNNETWSADWAAVERQGKTYNSVAWGLLGTGAAAAATGLGLTLWAMQEPEEAPPAASVTLVLDPAGGGRLACTGRF